jgi:hypothetical protein
MGDQNFQSKRKETVKAEKKIMLDTYEDDNGELMNMRKLLDEQEDSG